MKICEAKLKFEECIKIPKYYCDHSTHSSCSGGGYLVYIWDGNRYKGSNRDSKGKFLEPYVEVGAIIKQMCYFTNEEGLADISSCRRVFKINPNYGIAAGGGLTPKMLRSIANFINKQEK